MLGDRPAGRRTAAAMLCAALGAAGVVWAVDPFAGSDGGLEVSARGAVPTTDTTPEPSPMSRSAEPDGQSDSQRLGGAVTATREGETVVVERRDLDSGEIERLFTYEERRRYPGSDDPATADPPKVALSADGRQVAYSDSLSIRIRDLRSGRTRTVVSGVADSQDMPAHWSIPEMNTDPETDGVWGIWSVRDPEWAPDGEQIAFNQGWWEGSDFGIVDLASGRYHASPGGYDLEWIAGDGRAVTAGSSYTEPGRVHVARDDQPSNYTDITAAAPEHRSFDDVAVAADGKWLAVAWAESEEGLWDADGCCATLLRIDGTVVRQLPTGGMVQSLAFAEDSSSVFLAERRDGRSVLMRHPVAGGTPMEMLVLPSDLYGWTITVRPDGDLAMVGRTRAGYEGQEPGGCEANCPPYRSRLLIVDAGTGEIRYESPDLGRFTAVGGFTEN